MPRYRETENLFEQIKRLENRLATMERTAQLASSSIESGALAVNTNDGMTQTMQVGVQFDGTSAPVVLVSPTPPTPSAPVAAGVPGGVVVEYDGTFVGGALSPMDFSHFDVVVGPTGFDPILTQPQANIVSARGGKAFIALSSLVEHQAFVITRTLAGTASAASAADLFTPLAVASSTDISNLTTLINGKNTITHAAFAPTNEANTADDTWFVHGTINGNDVVIAQYVGLGGTSWAATTISHLVISSVDLGTATVGKLSAIYIDTGILAAAITLTGILVSGNPAGSRVVVDDGGIRQYDDSGNIRANLPTDPALPVQIEGSIIADSIISKDNFSLQGLSNYIERGAEVRIASGTGAPSTAPSVAVSYQTYDPNRWSYLFIPTGIHANTDDSPDLYACLTFFDDTLFLGPTNKTYTWPKVTDDAGKYRAKYSATVSGVGVYANSAERFVIMGLRCLNNGDPAPGSMDSFDMSPMNSGGTGVPVAKAHLAMQSDYFNYYQTRLGRVFSAVGSTLYRDRVAVAIRRVNTFNDIVLRQYTVTDTSFTQVGSDINVTIPFANIDESLIGVTHGSSDKLGFPGAAQFVWLIHSSTKTYAYNATGSARLTQFDFDTPAGASKMYAFGDITNNTFLGFRTNQWSDTTDITKLTNNHWDTTTTSSKWWVSTTNYDPDATGGTHETVQGPRASITMKKRAGITITAPPFPTRPTPTTTDDPTSQRIYLARGNTDPGRTFMELAGTVASPTRTLLVGDFTFPAGTAATPPPASSNFPASSPGKLLSGDGAGWVLNGDGTASIANVVFDATLPGYASAAMRLIEFVASNLSGSTTTSATGATMGTAGAEGIFTAPPSGVVEITVSCQLRSSSAGQAAVVGFEVKTGSTIGSGTVVQAFNIDKGALNANTSNIRTSMTFLVPGLTPGSVYNTRTVAAVTGGATNTYAHVRMALRPSP